MALRAFQSNPELGGFGSESCIPVASCTRTADAGVAEKDCDAFAQIIKELVDNAVDACSANTDENDSKEAKRVRVIIRRLQDDDDDDNDLPGGTNLGTSAQILRVTVIDNGCGMENVEECVDAFRSSKADNLSNGSDNGGMNRELTTGRYGIGLTLCLLHAQRLVPNSYASITSATRSASKFTRASYVVDVDGDSIRCDKIELIPKKFPEECGTAVSVLVPGGQTALRAWPRLAEYFARFQLSLGLICSLEVLAPSLSAVPLFIRAPADRITQKDVSEKETQKRQDQSLANNETRTDTEEQKDDDEFWTDGMENKQDTSDSEECLLPEEYGNEEQETNQSDEENNRKLKSASTNEKDKGKLDRRLELLAAATSYLKLPISLENVAHSIQPIRRVGGNIEQPQLEVDMIIYSPEENDGDADTEDYGKIDSRSATSPNTEKRKANLMLVRMVNRVPLLDSAEALACGLVRGLCWKQSTWNSFGLHVSPADERTEQCNQEGTDSTPSVLEHLLVPTYVVRDSDQVAPFFEKSTHSQLETSYVDDNDSKNDESELEEDGWEDDCVGKKRKKSTTSSKHRKLLPAHVRLGSMLVIAQIHAKPSSLPLPTLSKGRLPMKEKSIDDALELGILTCLRSLQTTNPTLLLTAQELKLTERDARYIPAAAAAIASIACKSENETFRSSILQSVRKWESEDSVTGPVKEIIPRNQDNESVRSCGSDIHHAAPTQHAATLFRLTTLGPLIEERLRWTCTAECRKKRSQRHKKKVEAKINDTRNDSESDNDIGLDEILDVQEEAGESESEEGQMEDLGERVLEKWEDPFDDDDSW